MLCKLSFSFKLMFVCSSWSQWSSCHTWHIFLKHWLFYLINTLPNTWSNLVLASKNSYVWIIYIFRPPTYTSFRVGPRSRCIYIIFAIEEKGKKKGGRIKKQVFKTFPYKINSTIKTTFSKSNKICYLSCRHILKRKRQKLLRYWKVNIRVF